MDRNSKTSERDATVGREQDSRLDRFFKITERGSTVGREIRGGVVTFFTMAYIIVLNPLIIGFAQDADGKFLGGGTAPNIAAVAAATALVAGVMTILMGVFANYPLALATGLGLNAFVAFSIASTMSWADAMGLVVLEGLVILVLVLTGFRGAVFHAVPAQLKVAISVGIGLFIALIGLVDAGWVRRMPDAAQTTVPVQLGGNGSLQGWPVLVFAFGLLLVIALYVTKVKGAILISIVGHHRVRDRRRGDRQRSARPWSAAAQGYDTRRAGTLNVPAMAGQARRRSRTSALLGHFSLFGSFERGRRRHRAAVRLHAAAGGLLRHDGHDDRDRRGGRPARRGGHAAEHPADPGRRLGRRGRRRRGRASRATRPTSSRPRVSARVRAPGWPRTTLICRVLH